MFAAPVKLSHTTGTKLDALIVYIITYDQRSEALGTGCLHADSWWLFRMRYIISRCAATMCCDAWLPTHIARV